MELKDVAQIIVGAATLALSVAMSRDTWELAAELSPGDVAIIACTSLGLITFFVYAGYFRGHFREHWPHLVARCRQPMPGGDSARRKAPRSVTRRVVHPCRGFAVTQHAEIEPFRLAQLFGGQNR